MTTTIHPTAIVEDGAEIGEGCEIGAFAFIGGEVALGDHCKIHHHATVEGFTTTGSENEVFPYALVGGKTHDLKFKGGRPGLKIGNRNVFREYTTIHPATNDGEFTSLGDYNTILAYSHVAHDCQIGDHLIMSSHSAFGGHVVCGDRVNIGWGAGVHQFCHIGTLAMIGAASKVVQDVPPFVIADGNPSACRTVNRVGLERAGYSAEDISLVHRVFKILFREGLNRGQSLEKLRSDKEANHRVIQQMLAFFTSSRRGVK